MSALIQALHDAIRTLDLDKTLQDPHQLPLRHSQGGHNTNRKSSIVLARLLDKMSFGFASNPDFSSCTRTSPV